MKSEITDKLPEYETIKILVPKNTYALSIVSLYEENGLVKMDVKGIDTKGLKELKAEN